MKKTTKVFNLLKVLRAHLDVGDFLNTYHSRKRQKERCVSLPEIIYVLTNGRHEKNKDKFDKKYSSWNYAVRGKTIDKKDLRIIVSLDENVLIIVTVIEIKI